MKNLWKVTFNVKYTHCHDFMEEDIKVVANGDGLKAVTKAKRKILGYSFEDGPRGKNETYVICKAVRVKLTGLELLHEIDA